jgi:hypothetical protein
VPQPELLENILSGIDITVSHIAAMRTHMSTNTQGFLDHFATLETCLRGETGMHSQNLMSGALSLGSKNSEELAPSSIVNAFRQVVVQNHIRDLQVLYHNMAIPVCVRLGNFEVVITPLAFDLEMGLCGTLCGFASLYISLGQ